MRYIIDCRTESGRLDFVAPQPEDVFGSRAITGIDADQMARVIFARLPEAELRGDRIPEWPTLLDSRFSARPKYW